jgi:hypothetical protein
VIRRIRGMEGLWSEMRVRINRVRIDRRDERAMDSRRGKKE